MKAPFFVPTRTRTPLISFSLLSFEKCWPASISPTFVVKSIAKAIKRRVRFAAEKAVGNLHSQRNQCPEPVIAQVQPSPDQRAENEREDDRKEPIADAHVRGDCAPQIARQHDGTKDGGTRNQIKYS